MPDLKDFKIILEFYWAFGVRKQPSPNAYQSSFFTRYWLVLTPAISNRHQKATNFICPSSNSKDKDLIGWRLVQLFRHAILLDFSCHHLSAESSTLAALLLHLEHHLQQLETGETSTFNQEEIRNTNRPIGQRRINWRMDNGYRRMASVNTSFYEKNENWKVFRVD